MKSRGGLSGDANIKLQQDAQTTNGKKAIAASAVGLVGHVAEAVTHVRLAGNAV